MENAAGTGRTRFAGEGTKFETKFRTKFAAEGAGRSGILPMKFIASIASSPQIGNRSE